LELGRRADVVAAKRKIFPAKDDGKRLATLFALRQVIETIEERKSPVRQSVIYFQMNISA
jgi:hypothetical protein